MIFTFGIEGGKAYAQSSNSSSSAGGSACDNNFRKSIHARATLEALREVAQAQSAIIKPDSVLEYTCFDRFLQVTAGAADSSFSDNRDQSDALNSNSLDKKLEETSLKSLNKFLDGNFSHSFYGGGVDSDHVPASSVSGNTNYHCDRMNEVWTLAKCSNFQQEARNEFFTFAELSSQPDIRSSGGVQCSPPNWRGYHDKALVNPDWQLERIEMYFDKMQNDNCSEVKPLFTGVMLEVIKRGEDNTNIKDAVCSVPGCYYNGSDACCSVDGGQGSCS